MGNSPEGNEFGNKISTIANGNDVGKSSRNRFGSSKEEKEENMSENELWKEIDRLRTALETAYQQNKNLLLVCNVFEQNSADSAKIQKMLIKATGKLGSSEELLDALISDRDYWKEKTTIKSIAEDLLPYLGPN
jgi:hypothetical protein